MTEQLYFDDPLTLEFDAQVGACRDRPDGRYALVLPGTFFYPTGGGQEHDTGTIGEARVLEVVKREGEILHLTDRALPPGRYPARIDRERRWRAMQHHTAQHILSAAFLEAAGIDSLSANINGYTPSTIDLAVGDCDAGTLRRAEALANRVLFEDRQVRSYVVTAGELAGLRVRKAARVTGRIRVVEVEGLDRTPCGGTHCPRTGMVGVLKIVRTERVNQKLRVHFVAGYQALEYFEACRAAAGKAASMLEVGWESLPAAVERRLEQLKALQVEAQSLRAALLAEEARRLEGEARAVGEVRLVVEDFRGREAAELRALADRLRQAPGLVAVLAGYLEGKLTLVAACAADSGVDARALLQHHLGGLGLRGGGDPSLAQGGGMVGGDVLEDLFERTRAYIGGAGSALS